MKSYNQPSHTLVDIAAFYGDEAVLPSEIEQRLVRLQLFISPSLSASLVHGVPRMVENEVRCVVVRQYPSAQEMSVYFLRGDLLSERPTPL
jgi:hypothetical protein